MCGQLNCIVNLNRRFCKQQRRNCLNSRKYARLKLKVNLDNSYCIGAAKLFMKKNILYVCFRSKWSSTWEESVTECDHHHVHFFFSFFCSAWMEIAVNGIILHNLS